MLSSFARELDGLEVPLNASRDIGIDANRIEELANTLIRVEQLQRATAGVNAIAGVDERPGLVVGGVDSNATADSVRLRDNLLVAEERRGGAGGSVGAVVGSE